MRTSLPNSRPDEQLQPVRRGRRWIWGLALVLPVLGLAIAALLAPSFILERIVEEAARRGVRLSGCSLELGFRSAFLRDCSFSTSALPDVPPPVPGVTSSGRVPEIEILLAGWEPQRLVLRRASVDAAGSPLRRDMLRSGASDAPHVPVEIEGATVTWRLSESDESKLLLRDLAYVSDKEHLRAKWEWPERASGTLSYDDGVLELAVGDRASVARLVVRPVPVEQRLDLGLELSGFPVAMLEGPSLRLTDTLRALRVDGRLKLRVPTGLDMELASGDLELTLHGLQFPVPREIEGLVHGSPPRVSGKLGLSRGFDRVNVQELTFLTGQLHMSGRAELVLDPRLRGLHFEAHMNGPLSCRAIAESAAVARVGSALGKHAGRFAKSVLTGDVQVIAALSGDTWELERTSVLTSIGVGCGLQPLPVAVGAAAELLSRLPAEVLQKLPRGGELPKLPELSLPEAWRRPRTRAQISPDEPRTNDAP